MGWRSEVRAGSEVRVGSEVRWGQRSERPPLSPQFEEVAEKDDLMGVEDTARKDILTALPHSCPIATHGCPISAP